jgi:hypothetical protein
MTGHTQEEKLEYLAKKAQKEKELSSALSKLFFLLSTLAICTLIIMLCWNYVLPNILRLDGYQINYWQALILRILSVNLFSRLNIKDKE